MKLGTEGCWAWAWRSATSTQQWRRRTLPRRHHQGICVFHYLVLLLILFIHQKVFASGVQPIDLESSQSHTVFLGHSVQLDCYPPTVTSDTDVFIVQWKKQHSLSPVYLWRRGQSEREGRGYEGRVTLVDAASLSLVDVRQSDAGLYDCQVWDVNGNPRVNGTTVRLEVLDVIPNFTRQPQSSLVAPGAVAEFECSVEPVPKTLRWSLDDRPVSAPGVLSSGGNLRVSVSRDANVQKIQSGAYRCVAEFESAVVISNPANLTVAVIAQFKEQEPVYVTVIQGGYAVIQGSIPFSIPMANVIVKHNGTVLPQSSPRIILMPSGNLHIQNVQQTDAGWYQFSAQNPVTQEVVTAKNSVILQVTVSEKNYSAQLLAAPKGANLAILGSNISLECAISGSPMPVILWNKFGGVLPTGRYQQVLGNLFLYDLRPNDTGTYVCQAENFIGLPVVVNAALDVLELPQIHKWTTQYEVREREDAVIECRTKGIDAKPEIRWTHNGSIVVTSNIVLIRESRLNIRYVQREHAGFYQCFASNGAATVHATALVRVIPRSAPNDDDVAMMAGRGHHREHGPHILDGNWGSFVGRNSTFTFIKDDADGDIPERIPVAEETVSVDNEDWPVDTKRNRKKNHKKSKKRKHGGDESESRVVMIPPTRPKVTKLTDESVMVRWDVPPNSGLPIQFFKVQYKDVVENHWMTIDEEIPPHVLSFEVLHLRTGHAYVFRIAGVYSNDDNKFGPKSHKFVLYKDPPMKKPIIGPMIVHAEAISPSAISVQWKYLNIEEIPIEGFFIYYRATTSAGQYTKITVLGANTQSYIISHLLPETAYDIKMQCFNSAGTSDFSNIHTEKSLPSPDSIHKNVDLYPTRPVPASNTASSEQMLYTIFGSVLGVLTLSLVLFVMYCSWKQHQRQKRREINSSRAVENGSLCDLAKYTAVNGSGIRNGHARGNGMFLWDKMSGDAECNHIRMTETSLVEVPARLVQNNNNGEAVSNEEDSAPMEEHDGDEIDRNGSIASGQDAAACLPLIHKQYVEGCADVTSDLNEEYEAKIVRKSTLNGGPSTKIDADI